MPTFQDRSNRNWTISVNTSVAKRVKELTGVDLLSAFGGELLQRFVQEPVLVADVLYAILKPQLEASGVDEIGFAESLVGDVFERATQAMLDGIADFFPTSRREAFRKLTAATMRSQANGASVALAKINTHLDDVVQFQMTALEEEMERKLMAAKSGKGSTN